MFKSSATSSPIPLPRQQNSQNPRPAHTGRLSHSAYFFTATPLTYFSTLALIFIAGISSIVFEISNGFLFAAVINILMLASVLLSMVKVIRRRLGTNAGVLISVGFLIAASIIRLADYYSVGDLFIHEIYTATFLYTVAMFLVGMTNTRLSSLFFFCICVGIVVFLLIISRSANLRQEFLLIGTGVFILLFTLQSYQNQMVALVRELQQSRENERSALKQEHTLRRKSETTLAQLQSTQQKIIMQAKLASLGTLTAGIAHEIKNPLNFVNNFSESSIELIDDVYSRIKNIFPREGESPNISTSTNSQAESPKIDPPKTEELKSLFQSLKYLQQNMQDIHAQGKRADQIVKSMLLHARESNNTMSIASINKLIGECITLAYHSMRAQNPALRVSIEKRLDRTAPKMEIYRSELTRALINLITNSLQSLVEKAARAEKSAFKPRLLISTEAGESTLAIRIEDNGIGIAQAIQEKILTPFFTTKPAGEGTGLGLSLSYEIIQELHGGSMHFESEEGSYARFHIALPYKQGRAPAPAVAGRSAVALRSASRIG